VHYSLGREPLCEALEAKSVALCVKSVELNDSSLRGKSNEKKGGFGWAGWRVWRTANR
jgi:hypothetical protein